MKKSLLLIFAAALALGGVLAFHQAAAQTNCPDVRINVANFNTKSNPIQKQFADCGKPKSVTLTKSGEIRSCKDINLVVQAVPDWSWDEATKTFKIWLTNNYNAKLCSTPGIVHWVVGYTLSWGGTTSTPEPVTTGYYCDRTDPVKPTCQPTTNSQITDTEYQCSLSCWPKDYKIEISRRVAVDDSFDPFSSTVGNEYGVGESITFQAEAIPQNNTAELGCASWSWDFGDGTKEGGQGCGPTNQRSHTYTTPGIYTITARVYNNTSANEVLHYPGFEGKHEVKVDIEFGFEDRDNFSSVSKESYGLGEEIIFLATSSLFKIGIDQKDCHIKFVFGDGNSIGSNCRVQDFDNSLAKVLHTEKHAYTEPGFYTVEAILKFVEDDPYSESEVARDSLNIKVEGVGFGQCPFYPNPTSDPLAVFDCLNKNLPVKIEANNFRQWVKNNRNEVEKYLLENQYCKSMGSLGDKAFELANVHENLLTASANKQPLPIVVAFGNLKRRVLRPLPVFEPTGYHSIISLDVKQIGKDEYKIKFLNPNGPAILSTICSIRQISAGVNPFLRIPTLYCDYNSGGLGGSLILNPELAIPNIVKVEELESNKVRNNPTEFLVKNYPPLDNGESGFREGVCAAWVDFALRAAYLIDPVGKTSWDWSSVTAAIGSWPWVELLLNFVRQ